ncbi:GTP-binding protein EngA (nucleomorph) [Cryptomonas paramecium]|uniref:GTP-binding protein EngA n=1 Tax=Cryptomonas paramaecium TaxID=2898 RepID=F2HI04_9CRYP|nr:GTP-binding protein EngA [Cryptomonas paramecium]AEA38950.1 GTP-binding protein EngA [Cryptomonas paramecium]|mmetsp:Transcript_86300/g.230473  ORF Transcript_86300/g.230473 Transcript_86300/m.230473 type:complete len:490 (-) Transcript_86300:507-1976(-)
MFLYFFLYRIYKLDHVSNKSRFFTLVNDNSKQIFLHQSRPKKSNNSNNYYNSLPDSFLFKYLNRNPVVIVIGKKNVGKNTFINKLTGDPEVEPHLLPEYKKYFQFNQKYLIIHTENILSDNFEKNNAKSLFSIRDSSLIIFMVNGKLGLSSEDIKIGEFLKLCQIPVLLVANKCENKDNYKVNLGTFLKLGFGEAIPMSSVHGSNLKNISSKIFKYFTNSPVFLGNFINIGIVGKLNSGNFFETIFPTEKKFGFFFHKKMSTNKSLLAKECSNFNIYNLIDTTPNKQKFSQNNNFDFFLTANSKTIRQSDCILFIINAMVGITEKDRKLAQSINMQKTTCIILVEKYEEIFLQKKIDYCEMVKIIRYFLPLVNWANILFLSSKKKIRYQKIFKSIDIAIEQYNRRIPTSVINEILQEAMKKKGFCVKKKEKYPKIYYSVQLSERPPTFAIFANEPVLIQESYKRYIENQFRVQLGFYSSSLKFFWYKKF